MGHPGKRHTGRPDPVGVNSERAQILLSALRVGHPRVQQFALFPWGERMLPDSTHAGNLCTGLEGRRQDSHALNEGSSGVETMQGCPFRMTGLYLREEGL